MSVQVTTMQDALAKVQHLGDRALGMGVFKTMADAIVFRKAVEDLAAGIAELFKIAQEQSITIDSLERAAAPKPKTDG
jgi:hypothetical protein